MKNLKIFAMFIVVAMFINACQKDINDLTVTLKQSGNLKVMLADSSSKAIANTKVKLYTNFTFVTTTNQITSSMIFDSKTTDSNGMVDFGELNAGTYFVVSEKVLCKGIKYNISKPVQVIAGSNAEITINPQHYVGKVTVNVTMSSGSSSGNTKVKNANVALINSEDYTDSLTHNQIISKALKFAKTDIYGKAVFESLPAYFCFYAYVYYSESEASWDRNLRCISVEKDEDATESIVVDSKLLLNTINKLNLTIKYYGQDSNYNYDYFPVKDANIILVDENTYYSMNLNIASPVEITKYKIVTGKTDSNGNVKLEFKAKTTNYKLFIYYSSTRKQWYSSSIYIYDAENNLTIQADEYSLGL